MLWWVFALTAVLLAPLAVLLAASLVGANPGLVAVAVATGVLAGVVQFLGLVRWPFLVPHLAREAERGSEAAEVVFGAMNRYLGVAVGEHLGYLFTGCWSVLSGVALMQATNTPGWLGLVGIVVGCLLMLCSLEFVGGFEEEGWNLAAVVTPIAYVAWSGWLIAVGVALLL